LRPFAAGFAKGADDAAPDGAKNIEESCRSAEWKNRRGARARDPFANAAPAPESGIYLGIPAFSAVCSFLAAWAGLPLCDIKSRRSAAGRPVRCSQRLRANTPWSAVETVHACRHRRRGGRIRSHMAARMCYFPRPA
jgi:hypothetical protein